MLHRIKSPSICRCKGRRSFFFHSAMQNGEIASRKRKLIEFGAAAARFEPTLAHIDIIKSNTTSRGYLCRKWRGQVSGESLIFPSWWHRTMPFIVMWASHDQTGNDRSQFLRKLYLEERISRCCLISCGKTDPLLLKLISLVATRVTFGKFSKWFACRMHKAN